MGRDKATLPFRRGLLLDHMIAILEATLGPKAEIHVSGEFPGYSCIPDRIPGLGPLGGLLSVVSSHPDRTILAVPVDMPALSPQTLRRLCQQASAPYDTDIDSAAFTGHELPLLLLARPRIQQELERLCHRSTPDSKRSLRELLAGLGTLWLELPAGQAREFLNTNTPEDWNAVKWPGPG